MLKTIGSEWFTITYEGKVDGTNQQLNKYLLTTKNNNSREHLYVYEDEIDQLINLLQKTKELLK